MPKLRQAIDGEYGGLRIEVTEVGGGSDLMHVTARVYDHYGAEVGHATRSYYKNAEGLSVTHSKFRLDKHVRGNGCATEFNTAMFEWYKESGVSKVDLQANIDVGSYAWARQKFDLANPQQAVDASEPRLKNEIDNAKGEVKSLEQERDSLPKGPDKKAMKLRVDQLHKEIEAAETMRDGFWVGSPDFPTAKAIADLGRPPGLLPEQARDFSWMGKRVFMEPGKRIIWHGVKRLDEE